MIATGNDSKTLYYLRVIYSLLTQSQSACLAFDPGGGRSTPAEHIWKEMEGAKCGVALQRNMIHLRKGRRSDTCYSTDEPWKLHAKWNEPDTKGHSDSTDCELSRIGEFVETESRLEITRGLGGAMGAQLLPKEHRVSVWGHEKFWK